MVSIVYVCKLFITYKQRMCYIKPFTRLNRYSKLFTIVNILKTKCVIMKKESHKGNTVMTHPFEKTLGQGPYRYVGMFTINMQAGAEGKPYYDPQLKHPNFVRGDGTCAHCGHGILNVYQIQTSSGEVFGVGSDCIHKANLPYDIKSKVERDEKAHERNKRRQREAQKLVAYRQELEALVKKYDTSLASRPHPSFSGKSLKDYATWALQNANPSTLKTVIMCIIKEEPNMEISVVTDSYVVALGNTKPFNEKFRSLGFSLKNQDGVWFWYRPILSDKYWFWEQTVEALNTGIKCFYINDLSKVNEAHNTLKALENDKPQEVVPHELDGAVFEVTKWYAQCFKENNNTPFAFRNLKVIKVSGETAKAYRVDAEFFSGIACSCGVCGLELSNDVSRATGIGPVCAAKLGLGRPTMENAKLIVEELEKRSKACGVFHSVWIPKSQIKNVIKTVE